MPYEPWERPSCQRCGGALDHLSEWCACGGRSARYSMRSAEPVEDAPEQRALSWLEAWERLWDKHVPPE
jgi:hypothetical protein